MVCEFQMSRVKAIFVDEELELGDLAQYFEDDGTIVLRLRNDTILSAGVIYFVDVSPVSWMMAIVVVVFLACALLISIPPLILAFHNYFFDAVMWAILAIEFWVVTLAMCYERRVERSGELLDIEAYW